MQGCAQTTLTKTHPTFPPLYMYHEKHMYKYDNTPHPPNFRYFFFFSRKIIIEIIMPKLPHV